MEAGSEYLFPGSLPPGPWFSNRYVHSSSWVISPAKAISSGYQLLLPPIAHLSLGCFDSWLSCLILKELVPACLLTTHPGIECSATVLYIEDIKTKVDLQ